MNTQAVQAGFDVLWADPVTRTRGWPDGPWEIELRGRRWACLADSHTFLAVRRDLFGDLPKAPEKVLTVVGPWMERQGEATPLNAGDLKAFTPFGKRTGTCEVCKGERRVECADCNGEGESECICECGDAHSSVCETCDGERYVDCEECQPVEAIRGGLLGGVINCWKLATVLEAVTPDDSENVLARREKGDRYVFESERGDWMALIMGIHNRTPHREFKEAAKVSA